MKMWIGAGALGALAISVTLAGVGQAHYAKVVRSTPGTPTVVVELFTSEGCSSCPPADTVLADLARSQPVGGVHIVALGEHVDYWDHGGWRDPFSANFFTQRQSAYATAFRNEQVYTPEMVVQGQAEFIGSDGRRAHAEIGRAALHPQASVRLEASAGAAGIVRVKIDASSLPAGSETGHLFAGLTQDGLESQVAGGENRGRKLTHAAVVRSLADLGALHVVSGRAVGETDIKVDPALPTASLHAVAFVQSMKNGHIYGAAEVPLAGLDR